MNHDPHEETLSVAPVPRTRENPRPDSDPGDELFFQSEAKDTDSLVQDASVDLFEYLVITDHSANGRTGSTFWPEIPPQDLAVSAAQTAYGSSGSLAEPRTPLFTAVRVASLGAILYALALVGGWILLRPATLPIGDRSAQGAPPAAASVERSAPTNATPASSESPPQVARVRPSAPPVTNGQDLRSASSQAVAQLPSGKSSVSGASASLPRPSLGPGGTNSRSAPETAADSIPDVPESPAQRALEEIRQSPIAESVVPPAAASSAATLPPVAPDVARGAATTSATSATSATPAAIASLALAADEQRVRAVLNRYREAYGSLDVNAARAVWPGVDTRTLGRAFAQLSMQEFEFAACDISISGERASADCTGNARYVPKVGSKNARVETRVWQFGLRRIDQQWKIETTGDSAGAGGWLAIDENVSVTIRFSQGGHSEPSAFWTSTHRSPRSYETKMRHGLQQTSQSWTSVPRVSGSM